MSIEQVSDFCKKKHSIPAIVINARNGMDIAMASTIFFIPIRIIFRKTWPSANKLQYYPRKYIDKIGGRSNNRNVPENGHLKSNCKVTI